MENSGQTPRKIVAGPWNQPVPEQYRNSDLVEKHNEIVRKEWKRLNDLKEAWLDRLASHYFPDHIYVLAKNRKRLRYVAKWIKDQGYEIREVPSQMLTQFCQKRDDKVEVLAEFKIESKA